MSKIFKQIKNIFRNKELSNNTSNSINNCICDNKCKGNNNNLDSSKKNIDEIKNNIITDTFNYSPDMSFSSMPMIYHNNCFINCWNGLKLSLIFRPTQFFNLDYMLNIEKNKKLFNNYSLNCSTYVPLSSILFPINLILIGHKKSSRAFSFQSHLLLGEKDKLSILTNNIPKDAHYNNNILNEEETNLNQNNTDEDINKNELENKYSIEYNHEFKRGNFGIKCTNFGHNTVNFQVSIYNNLFFGMEFFRNPKKEAKSHFLKANYGIMLKQTPLNKFGITFNYISTLPASIINCCYQINNNFKLYLNTVFNRNELLIKMGQDKFSAALSSCYQNDFIVMNTELNNKGEVKFLSTFSYNKYIDILMNFTYSHFARKNTNKFKYFGFGLNIKNNSVEEKIEELIESQKKVYRENPKYFYNYNNIMKLK